MATTFGIDYQEVHHNEPINTVLGGFQHIGAKATFENVDGFAGGRTKIGFFYASKEKQHVTRLRLIVNNSESVVLSFPENSEGGYQFDYSEFTAVLKPGKTNTIELIGGAGELYIEAISTEQPGYWQTIN